MYITMSDRYNAFILYCRKTNRVFRSYHAKTFPESPYRLGPKEKSGGSREIDPPQLQFTNSPYKIDEREVDRAGDLSAHMLTQASQSLTPSVHHIMKLYNAPRHDAESILLDSFRRGYDHTANCWAGSQF